MKGKLDFILNLDAQTGCIMNPETDLDPTETPGSATPNRPTQDYFSVGPKIAIYFGNTRGLDLDPIAYNC